MFTRRVSGAWPQTPAVVAANNIQGRYTNLLVQGTSGSQKARIVFQDYNSTSLTGPQTVRVADEPTDWQHDAWDISNRLYTGGGPEIKAVRVSDTEFYYTRVGDNPTSPTLYVSNSVYEGRKFDAKTTSAFSNGGVNLHASVVFDNKMWVLGGLVGTTDTNYVYSSADGATWDARSTTGTFTARRGHAAVVRNGTIYVIGGENSSGLITGNDVVYSSTDGLTWQQVVTTTPLPARTEHTAVVVGADIYVIGGRGVPAGGGSAQLLDEIWKFDGTDWSQVSAGARFSPRMGHASYVYDNKIWVVGGYDAAPNGASKNDAWYSADGGSTWATFTTGLVPFPGRRNAGAAVFDNRMWILGGHDSSDYDSVYWSTDGKTWTRADDSLVGSGFNARREFTSLVFNNRLWAIGGYGASGVGQSVYYARNSATA